MIDMKLILEHSSSLNLLYVEDDDELRSKTRKLFENFFKTVHVAINGEEALHHYNTFFNANGQYYDMVVTDINMPVMNGMELISEVIKINPDQSIVIVSAYNEVEFLHKAIELGVSGFLTKPIESAQFKRVLYKTTQAITDRKLAQRYYEQLENDSTQTLLVQESKEKAPELCSTASLVEAHKEELSKVWVEHKVVQQTLQKYQIESEFFRTNFAIKVIEYFIGILKGKNLIGSCPVINEMLKFYAHKKLPVEHVFLICINFKNTMNKFLF